MIKLVPLNIIYTWTYNKPKAPRNNKPVVLNNILQYNKDSIWISGSFIIKQPVL